MLIHSACGLTGRVSNEPWQDRIGTRHTPLAFERWLGTTLWHHLFPLFQQCLEITVQDVENPESNLMITQFISKTWQFPGYRCLHRRHQSKRPWFVLMLVWAHRCSQTAHGVGCAEIHQSSSSLVSTITPACFSESFNKEPYATAWCTSSNMSKIYIGPKEFAFQFVTEWHLRR